MRISMNATTFSVSARLCSRKPVVPKCSTGGASCRAISSLAKQRANDTICRAAADAASPMDPDSRRPPGPPSPGPGSRRPAGMLAVIIAVTVALTAAATFYLPLGNLLSQCLSGPRELLQTAPAFIESLTLIFMSELGDKTFFIAALLSIRFGKAIAVFGSVLSLGVMTVVSVGIGRVFAQIPQFVDQGANFGQYMGAALLLYFGVKSLSAGLSSQSEPDEELHDAEEELQEAERTGKLSGGAWWAAFWQTASLIFLAEWGDRSMLATIALAIKSDPIGVATGATLGHAIATVIAVSIGSIASKYISEKVVQIIGGVLFLVFALETGLGLGIL